MASVIRCSIMFCGTFLLTLLLQFCDATQATPVTSAAEHTSKHKHKCLMKSGKCLVPKYTVHGAIIMSDRGGGGDDSLESAELAHQRQLLVSARLKNFHQLASELPFSVTEWAAVFTSPCPSYPDGHKTERGLIWAHYRIIREFSFFDPVLLSKLSKVQKDPALVETNLPLHSKNGLYVAYPNGTLIKNNQPFLDGDIISIFEDDAEGAIADLGTTIIEEFQAMNVDLLFLGWCEGRWSKPVPLCAHAYALTRAGARKVIESLEPCGRALDEQFVMMAKSNLITWRRAHGYSYKVLNEKYKNMHGEKTYGLFHQNKALGSINGH